MFNDEEDNDGMDTLAVGFSTGMVFTVNLLFFGAVADAVTGISLPLVDDCDPCSLLPVTLFDFTILAIPRGG